MAENSKPRTHVAYAYRREGKKFGRLLEIGTGSVEKERDGVVHVFLDRLPIGGFAGYILLSPIDKPPPLPEVKPRRPGQDDDSEEDSED